LPEWGWLNKTDDSLLNACRSGDRRAWELLIRRYERMLFGIARRAGLSVEDAEDVFQTVCVRLLDNLDRLSTDGHLQGWLILTARREAWEVARRRRRDAVPERGDRAMEGLEDVASEDALPADLVEQWDEQQLVQRGLEELGARCRQLLTLLYHSEPPLSYAEVADRLQVSVGAIGPTRARCLQQLKRILLRLGF
jgi:RNA polymerase sigma factor (sigma-70 family)